MNEQSKSTLKRKSIALDQLESLEYNEEEFIRKAKA